MDNEQAKDQIREMRVNLRKGVAVSPEALDAALSRLQTLESVVDWLHGAAVNAGLFNNELDAVADKAS